MFVRMKIYQTTYPPNIIRHITFTARLVLFKRAEIYKRTYLYELNFVIQYL